MQHVYLVPGFFGFANLGNIVYFAHVREALEARLGALGVEAAVHPIPTDPTASIPRRAVCVLEAVQARPLAPGDGIHLIGHSTGGLDIRLLVSPGVNLPTDRDVEAVASRVRSVVSVSSPHRGTPVASFFNSMFGQQVLRLLSLATMHTLRYGPLPLSSLLKLGALFMRLDDHLGLRDTVADHLFEELLRDFTPERRETIQHLLDQMGQDSTLLGQLTPEGTELLNALSRARPTARYASVVNATPEPGARSVWTVGLDPYAQATHALYFALYRITGRATGASPGTTADVDLSTFEHDLGFAPTPESNDGIVPLASQPWGEVIHVARADHLDVIGHLDGGGFEPPHRDWFSSGSRFGRPEFLALWESVARYVAAAC